MRSLNVELMVSVVVRYVTCPVIGRTVTWHYVLRQWMYHVARTLPFCVNVRSIFESCIKLKTFENIPQFQIAFDSEQYKVHLTSCGACAECWPLLFSFQSTKNGNGVRRARVCLWRKPKTNFTISLLIDDDQHFWGCYCSHGTRSPNMKLY